MGIRELLTPPGMPCELIYGGVRMLVRMTNVLRHSAPADSVDVSFEILDVLEPPEARRQFLEEMERRNQLYARND